MELSLYSYVPIGVIFKNESSSKIPFYDTREVPSAGD